MQFTNTRVSSFDYLALEVRVAVRGVEKNLLASIFSNLGNVQSYNRYGAEIKS